MAGRHFAAARGRTATYLSLLLLAVIVLVGALVSGGAPAQLRARLLGAGSPAVPPAPAAATTRTPAPAPPRTSPPPATRAPASRASAQASVHSVVGLGDSVPAGTNCGCTDLVRLVAAGLARSQGADVSATNLASAGETSDGLLEQLDDAATRQAIQNADVVLVNVGANDFDSGTVTDAACADPTAATCYGDDLGSLSQTMGEVLDRVAALTHGRVVVTGYWNVFLDGAVGRGQGDAYVRNSDALTRAVNSGLASAAAGHGATYVDVYRPFKGDGDRDDTGLLAPDGDHPNAQGHAVLAATITAALTATGT
jgi:lysophospholipase L1-like esterase